MSKPNCSVVYYRFVPIDEGISLELWEPKPSPDDAASYQFRLRYQFTSISTALAALHDYLKANGVEQAIAHPIDEANAYFHESLAVATLG
ncbi:hypothetical protein PN498_16515 [Oscillatoria sp. CS-180]|nr:hypothetical protein [Oscillatoria sp. CS-180]